MRLIGNWVQLQLENLQNIVSIAKFEKRALHQNNYFGLLWEFLNPAIQIIIYYIIFGIRLSEPLAFKSNVPYIYWMLIGIIPWFYMSSSIVLGASSIHSNLSLISKTHFPVEILPTISVVKGLNSFFSMLGLFLLLFITEGYTPTWQWMQLLYYLFVMILFLTTLSILFSVITVLFRDFQFIVNSVMRLLFFVSGAVVDVNTGTDSLFTKLFKLNPFVYIIEGFRDSLLSRTWFYLDVWWSIYFWSLLMLLLFSGLYLINKYKAEFVEYM